jgi:hypothetical protein
VGHTQKFGWGKKAPALTVSQVRRLLQAILPLKTLTLLAVLALGQRTQQRNHKASLAHRKRCKEGGSAKTVVSEKA